MSETDTPVQEIEQEDDALVDNAAVVANDEGYVEVGSVSYDEESRKFTFDDLRPVVEIDKIDGISATLNRPSYSSPHGEVLVRLIHDAGGRVFLYRKDEDDTTYFKVGFKLQAL